MNVQLEFTNLLKEIEPKPEPVHQQMEFNINPSHTPNLYFNSQNNSELLWTISYSSNIVFYEENKECGKFSWKDGVFKFDGNADASAKLFAKYIADYCGLRFQP